MHAAATQRVQRQQHMHAQFCPHRRLHVADTAEEGCVVCHDGVRTAQAAVVRHKRWCIPSVAHGSGVVFALKRLWERPSGAVPAVGAAVSALPSRRGGPGGAGLFTPLRWGEGGRGCWKKWGGTWTRTPLFGAGRGRKTEAEKDADA
eukprot:362899-Chlamydomonas_euryale.AAC.3